MLVVEVVIRATFSYDDSLSD